MMLHKYVFTIKWDYKLKKVTATVEEAKFHVITSHESTGLLSQRVPYLVSSALIKCSDFMWISCFVLSPPLNRPYLKESRKCL